MEKGKPVVIDQEKLAKMLDDVSDSFGRKGHVFTPLEDAFILAVWEKRKNKLEAAKKLGICEASMRARYNELTRGGK